MLKVSLKHTAITDATKKHCTKEKQNQFGAKLAKLLIEKKSSLIWLIKFFSDFKFILHSPTF